MNNAEFLVIEEGKSSSIVRVILKKDSGIGKHYNVLGDISLPYFISNEELKNLNSKEDIELNEHSLLKGLKVFCLSSPYSYS